jgi:hypothetical protein
LNPPTPPNRSSRPRSGGFVNSATPDSFALTRTEPLSSGACTATWSLTGSYTGPDTLSANFTATFTGSCGDCEENLFQYLADGGEVRFFLDQQVREERLKAQLILRNVEWRAIIEETELHPYFKGQIEFLFAFSGLLDAWLGGEEHKCDWSEEQDASYRSEVQVLLKKAAAVFSAPSGGLATLDDFVWERTLLCHGDYLLRKSSNWNFLVDTERDISWKRLLPGEVGV